MNDPSLTLQSTRERTFLDDYFDTVSDEDLKFLIRHPKYLDAYAFAWDVTKASLAEALLDCYLGRKQGKRTDDRRRNDEAIHLASQREGFGNANHPSRSHDLRPTRDAASDSAS